MNYKLAFALGLIPPGAPGSGNIMYSYNGLMLHDIAPLYALHKDTNPYAYIRKDTALFFITYPLTAVGTDFRMVGIPSSAICYIVNENGEWEHYETHNYNSSNLWYDYVNLGTAETINWVNHDVKDSEGVVVLAASDPVPVYE